MQTIKIIPYLILILTIPSVIQWLDYDTSNLTVIWWTINSLILFYFVKGKNIYFKGKTLPLSIKLFLILVFIQALHGLFRSVGYWDYKNLINNIFIFSLPLCIFVFSKPNVLSNTLHIWIKYALILFWFFLPFMQPEAPGKYLIPIMFLVMFIKVIPLKYKLLVLLYFSFVFIYGTLGARATSIRYLIALIFGLGLYFNVYRNRFFVKIIHIAFIIFPIFTFILGVSGIFNIFKIGDYIPNDEILVTNSFDANEQENLTSDTRTFLYVEAINSSIKNNYFIWGNSLSRGYDSFHFSDVDFYNRGERYASEVSIINIFTYFGLIGVIVYFIIFFTASYKAIYRSKNIYMKMIGLYVAFRWLFAWVEDFNRFDLNYLFIWIMISMCFSRDFLYMNNIQFERWIKSIFNRNKTNYVKTNSYPPHLSQS